MSFQRSPTRSIAQLLRLLPLAVLLTGCGLKGPLRLPDRAQPVDEPAAQQDAEQQRATPPDAAQ